MDVGDGWALWEIAHQVWADQLNLSQQEGADFDLFLHPTLLLVHPVLASFLRYRYWSPSMNLP